MEFAEFFKAVHGFKPFPWQRTLASHVAESGTWPAVIDLPTASGKTAVLDVAVWHLAQQGKLPPAQRTAPRRIWFVVDRRIVVDEAYRRAKKIARWLADPENRDADIVQALYEVSGLGGQGHLVPPLSYGRLRGGILQDSGWASFPSQPAILTSTVDQFGSRLLFRGYGMGPGMWPVHAALAGNDSLLVLDEAHLAEPLMQTLRWVQHYRDDRDQEGAPPHDGPRWCEQKIELPWQMTLMSATPPMDESDRFPATARQREAALDHPLLQQRTGASKPARLIAVDKPKASKNRPATACAAEAARCAAEFVAEGRQRVAVMMNRVDAALAVHDDLAKRDDVDVVLLTGRMRPFDRDRMVDEWCPQGVEGRGNAKGLTHWLGARLDPPELPRPIVLVTTQCLEVGADLSFDAMATECASIDALRQRFGRLNRFGIKEWGPTPSAILAWCGDVDGSRTDPIYGDSLLATWNWLNEQANDGTIDFGITALDATLGAAVTDKLLPPRPNAPVLLPAYLDAWCQTGPRPHMEASPALFLHGITDEQADVQVAFRHDLTEELSDEQWAEIVRLTPPVSGELLTVRLHRLRQWFAGEAMATEGDVEGAEVDDAQKSGDSHPERWVHYGGQGEATRTVFLDNASSLRSIHPGDILVIPADERIPRSLGHGDDGDGIDIHEQAVAASGRRQTFRLTPQRLAQWSADHPDANAGMEAIHTWLATEDGATDMDEWPDIRNHLLAIVPKELHEAIHNLGDRPKAARPDGLNGIVLTGPRPSRRGEEVDPFGGEDSESLAGEEQALDTHSRQVANLVRDSARCCVPAFTDVLERAAELHDQGKDEPRFQALLHNRQVPWGGGKPLAKSGEPPSPKDHLLRQKLNIVGFRHEMLSMQEAAEQHGDDDLLLHLIASHHGHARPFAPVFKDSIWTDLPPHHIGSGVSERFWKLTRRHGWWGLAYLEAILRLADHQASRFPRDINTENDHD